jgi:hypothetical protein
LKTKDERGSCLFVAPSASIYLRDVPFPASVISIGGDEDEFEAALTGAAVDHAKKGPHRRLVIAPAGGRAVRDVEGFLDGKTGRA